MGEDRGGRESGKGSRDGGRRESTTLSVPSLKAGEREPGPGTLRVFAEL